MLTWVYVDGDAVEHKLDKFQSSIMKDEPGMNGVLFGDISDCKMTLVPLRAAGPLNNEVCLAAVRIDDQIRLYIDNVPTIKCTQVPLNAKYRTYRQFLVVFDQIVHSRRADAAARTAGVRVETGAAIEA